MPTIIDSLIVQLGLDPSGYTKGSADAQVALKKTRESAKSAAEDVEAFGKRTANFIGSVKTEVVGLFLAFAGAKGLGGFVEGIISNDAAVGRFSKNVGLATEKIGAWQVAVKEAGGSNEDAFSALGIMAKAASDTKLGLRPENSGVLAALGVNQDTMKDPSQMLMRIAEASQRMDPTVFSNLATRLGFTPSMIALLERGSTVLAENMPRWERIGRISQEDARAAQDLQEKLADLSATIQSKARPYIGSLANTLGHVLTNSDAADEALKGMTPALVAVGVLAAAAGAPFVALAAAIGAVAANWKTLKHDWQGFEGWWDKLLASSDKNAPLNHLRSLFGISGTGSGYAARLKAAGFSDAQIRAMAGNDTAAISGPAGGSNAGGSGIHVALAGNNPGGIIDGPFARHQAGYAGANGRYARFSTLAYGEAAQRALLASYIRRGIDTPAQIASRWAPAGDGRNDPAAYARSMAKHLHIGVNDHIRMIQLAQASVAQGRVENRGYRPTEVSIGSIVVNAPSGDPHAIARGVATEIPKALRSRSMTTQADGPYN